MDPNSMMEFHEELVMAGELVIYGFSDDSAQAAQEGGGSYYGFKKKIRSAHFKKVGKAAGIVHDTRPEMAAASGAAKNNIENISGKK